MSARSANTLRINGTPVLPLLPRTGAVHVLILGEAPGPRGADKSGVPFFGDAAGKPLYEALARLGAVTLPAETARLRWDGSEFAMAAITPLAHGVALGNAYDRCPTDNGATFRAPTRRELESEDNVARLRSEVERLRRRGLSGVVCLGRVAARTMDGVLTGPHGVSLQRRDVPHPSAQGLLSMAPDRGRGTKMKDLQEQWQRLLCDAVVDVGFPDTRTGDIT